MSRLPASLFALLRNAVLDDGALPLTVLEARIDERIAAERLRAGRT